MIRSAVYIAGVCCMYAAAAFGVVGYALAVRVAGGSQPS